MGCAGGFACRADANVLFRLQYKRQCDSFHRMTPPRRKRLFESNLQNFRWLVLVVQWLHAQFDPHVATMRAANH